MKVLAPGKLVLTGAYAVLEGAPAVVVAVDRYASAPVDAPDTVDVTALHDGGGAKLGLGSSAASLVASEGARRAARGEDLAASGVRAELFEAARRAHAAQQGGGSGVDVAAAVHGGALVYSVRCGAADARGVPVPPGLSIVALFSGTSARTSDLRARVDAARRGPGAAPVFEALRGLAEAAAGAFEGGDTRAFVAHARDFGAALGALGDLADAPIVPRAFAELGLEARASGAAFFPSGAGGGDVGVWLGLEPPGDAFVARASALRMRRLDLGVDPGGVRLSPSAH